MNYYILFLTLLGLSNSFFTKVNRIPTKLYALKNYNEKPYHEMDIFEKFEKYSHENNKEKQAEYLYKIKAFLNRKYKKKNWQKNIKN